MLRRALLEEGILNQTQLERAPLATDLELTRAHDPAYVASIEDGTIDAKAMRRIGFPWSAHIAKRARATMGGAIAGAREAMQTGFSGQLAGGTHHAHYDFGAGYCIYNDFAVAALALIAEGLATRIAIVDLDVHQGDGNAALLANRHDCFILSVHGEKNFPFRKFASDLDLNLPDGVEDSAYLAALDNALPAIWAFNPDIVFYQAGVDPLKEDKLGRMALSHQGLIARDRMVFGGAARRGIPLFMAIGGGYADPIELSVAAYVNSWRAAKNFWAF